MRIWAPPGSTPNLGNGYPSGTIASTFAAGPKAKLTTSKVAAPKVTTPKVTTHKPVEVNVKVQAASVGGKHQATTHKKSFLASLFSFPF